MDSLPSLLEFQYGQEMAFRKLCEELEIARIQEQSENSSAPRIIIQDSKSAGK